MRTITVIATRNGKIKKYETAVSTWGELKSLIQDDYDLSNLKPTENINKTTLEHRDAMLPQDDFRLFLRPAKTKSGADDNLDEFNRRDLIQLIKSIGDDLENQILKEQHTNNLVFVSKKELRKAIRNHRENSTNDISKHILIDLEEAVVHLSNAQEELIENDLGGNKLTQNISSIIDLLNSYIDMLEEDDLLSIDEDDIPALNLNDNLNHYQDEIEELEQGFDD